MKRSIYSPKVVRPAADGLMPRPRLYKVMDKVLQKGHLWVSAPAGSGKTSLASAYIESRNGAGLWYRMDAGDAEPATFFYYAGQAAKRTGALRRQPTPLLMPEYQSDVPTFARRFFEQLYRRLRPPVVAVFDDYHELPAGSALHEIFEICFSLCPEGVNILVLSREGPPPSLARLVMEGKLHLLGWKDIRLTRTEAAQMLAKHEKGAALAGRLHSVTAGWVAGLLFLIDREDNSVVLSDYTQVFSYFAHEVVRRLDSEMMEFLLKTAFLPTMSANMATRLSGNAQAGRVLQELHARNCFIEKVQAQELSYRFHPLFRRFLLSWAAEKYSEKDRMEMIRAAAGLLSEAGQIEEAASLFIESGQFEGLAKLVRVYAGELLSHGRNKAVIGWLSALPTTVLEQDPWIAYWFGACMMPYDPEQARAHFERALSAFDRGADGAGAFTSWVGLVESIMHQLSDLKGLDVWFKRLDELVAKYKAFPSKEIEDHVASRMLMALALRKPDHPHFEWWKTRASEVLDKGNASPTLKMLTGFYLFTAYIWAGDFASASLLMQKLLALSREEATPLARVTAGMAHSWYLWHVGLNEECLLVMEKTLRIAEDTGVHLWDYLVIVQGIVALLSQGRVTKADALIERLQQALGRVRGFDRFYYYHQLAWKHLLEGDVAMACEAQKKAVAVATEVGVVYGKGQAHYGMSQVLHAQGDEKGARKQLALVRRYGRRLGSRILAFMCHIAEAQYAFDQRSETVGARFLTEAFRVGRDNDFVNFSWWNPRCMAKLCQRALKYDIETDYAKKLIRERGLVPADYDSLEDWPWLFKVYTLGRFGFQKDGRSIRFDGKTPHKPIALLMALIAGGGADISEHIIGEALWPGADGETAAGSLKTNLHRLRKLLDRDDGVILQGGRLSLNSTLFWTDAWAFEVLVKQADVLWMQSHTGRAADLYAKAMALYQGHFLLHDPLAWTVCVRDRLKAKLVHAVSRKCLYLEKYGQLEEALDLYQNAIQMDALEEEFWMGLMRCLHGLGRRTEAVRTYHRFRELLKPEFGLAPTDKMNALLDSILA